MAGKGKEFHLGQPNPALMSHHLLGLEDEIVLMSTMPIVEQGQHTIALLNKLMDGQNQPRKEIHRKQVYEPLLLFAV